MCALRALPEVWLGFFDRSAEGMIVRWALNGAFNLVSGVASLAKKAAEQAASSSQGAPGHSRYGRLELGHEAVAAAIAQKFELKSFVGRVVVMIPRELDQSHGSSGTVFGKLGLGGGPDSKGRF